MPDALTDRQRRFSENPGTATYGAIVVTAAIAAAASHDDREWAVLIKVTATVAVFWLAHVHSAFIEERFANPTERAAAALRHAVGHELVMLEVCAAPLAFLLAGELSLLDDDTAVTVAMWTGVAELFAIGLLRAKRSRHRAFAAVGIGLVYAAAGVGLVALKVAVH